MSDLIVTFSALVVAGGFGYLYYRDLNQQFVASGQKPIGTVVYEQNDTQRRFNNRVVWQQVGDNTPLYNLDSVRTVKGSQAVIRLIDGTRIVMQPNTLITLDWGAKAKTVDFLSGSITAIHSGGGSPAAAAAGSGAGGAGAAAPAGLVIRSGSSRVAVSNATVNLSASAGNRLAVTVSGGNASLISGGAVHTLSASQVASVDTATGAASVSTALLVPTRPLANAIYVTEGGKVPVPFSWRSNLRAPQYALEIASSPEFGAGAQSVKSTSTSLNLALGRGTHFWKVQANGASSPPEQLTILQDSTVSPLEPASGAVYSYDFHPPLVLFSWSASKIASGYELQIASDRQFTNVVQQTQSATNAIAVGTLTAGTYYWRVKPLYDFAASSGVGASSVASFRIVHSAVLAPARLVSPAPFAVLNAVTVQSAGVLFNWQSDNNIAQWSFALSRTPDMRSVIARAATPDNYDLMRTPLDPGRYFWQVRGVASNGAEAPASEIRSFTVSLEHARITLESPRMNWNYDQATVANVPVVWKSNVKGNFEVDLSTRPGFSNLFDKVETTFQNASFGSLPPGSYYWHVRLIGRDGSTLLSSIDGTFTVMPALLAPLPLSPVRGQVLRLINPKSLDFSWDGDPRSQFYDLALYRLEANGVRREIARAKDLTTNQYKLKDLAPLAVGAYTWVIAARNTAGFDTSAQATLPVSADFQIGSLRIVGAPQLIAPPNGATIAGPQALDQGVDLSWLSPDPLGTAVVEVSSDPSFTEVLKRLQTGPEISSVHLTEILPGSYYWRVNVRTHDGIDAPPSATNELTVAALESLAQPTGLLPAPGGSEDLWNRKALTLSWSPVPDATGYTISLTNASSDAPVFSNVKVSGTSYSYSDLQNLNVGLFRWQIQAYQTDRSGQVVRTSAPLEVNFNIVLGNKIGTPRVKAPSRVFVH